MLNNSMFVLLLVACVCVHITSAIDCRRYAFAPACRGIMVKRGGARADTAAQDNGLTVQEANKLIIELQERIVLMEEALDRQRLLTDEACLNRLISWKKSSN